MIFQHLNDANTYQKADEKCDNRVIKKIGELGNKYESMLTKAEKLYLTNISEAIHQQNNEYIEINEPDDLTLRPIVGAPNCPTRPLSQLIDIILKPFLIHINSYVKDNLDFLRKCSRKKMTQLLLLSLTEKAYTQVLPIIMALKQKVSG